MKQLFAFALVGAIAVAPACAQSGGGAHGGSAGGFHGGGVAPHGGPAANHGGPAAPHGGHGEPGAPRGGHAATGGFSRPVSVSGRPYEPRYGDGDGWATANPRPSVHHGGWKSHGAYAVPYTYGVAVGNPGYAWPGSGWVDPNGPGDDSGYEPGEDSGYDQGSGDNGDYDVGPYPDEAGLAPEGYGPQMPDREEAPMPYGPEGPNAGSAYEPRTAEPLPAAVPAAAARTAVYDDEAVTLIFKDGRAPEKIYNYALTRTTLYVTDAKRREIPVAALDLAATEKANRAAGVRFQLPMTQ